MKKRRKEKTAKSIYVKRKNASYSLRKFYDFVIVQSANVFGYGALAHLSAIRVHLEYEK